MAGDIDGLTVLSNLSLNGSGATLTAKAVVTSTLSATGAIQVSNFSAVNIAASSQISSGNTLRVGGQAWFGSGISVGSSGNTGTLIPAISSTSSLCAPFVVQGSASSFTIILWPAAKARDMILVTPGTSALVSSISSGLVAHSHCTQDGQIEFRLSNVSTLVQNQSTQTWNFTRISPF